MIVDPLNHNFLSLNTQKNHLNTNLPPNKTYYFLFNLLINAFVMYLSGRKFSPSAKNGARDQLTIIVIIFRRSVSFIFCLQWVLNCFPCRWNRRQRWKKKHVLPCWRLCKKMDVEWSLYTELSQRKKRGLVK